MDAKDQGRTQDQEPRAKDQPHDLFDYYTNTKNALLADDRRRLCGHGVQRREFQSQDGLLALLSHDVVMHTDGGGKANALPLPVYGPAKVARASVFGLSKLKTLKPLQRIVEINGEPGIVSYVDGRPQSVFTIEVNKGRIHAIYIVTNPEKLSHLPPPPF